MLALQWDILISTGKSLTYGRKAVGVPDLPSSHAQGSEAVPSTEAAAEPSKPAVNPEIQEKWQQAKDAAVREAKEEEEAAAAAAAAAAASAAAIAAAAATVTRVSGDGSAAEAGPSSAAAGAAPAGGEEGAPTATQEELRVLARMYQV